MDFHSKQVTLHATIQEKKFSNLNQENISIAKKEKPDLNQEKNSDLNQYPKI